MTDPLILCVVADLAACGHRDWGHHCSKPLGHPDDHGCECEPREVWPRDPVYELACRLYVAHWTVRYLDVREVPSRRVVEAACRPADSSWRVLAVVALAYCGVA